MRNLAIGAICVGALMLFYIVGTIVHLWMLNQDTSVLHDTYYVEPTWRGPVIFVSIAVFLICWGVWLVRSKRGA